MSTPAWRLQLQAQLSKARAAFEARAPRERLLLAAAAAAALFYVADALWLSPALRSYNQARSQHRSVSLALAEAQAERARRASGALTPAQQLERDIEQARQRVAKMDRELGEQSAGLVSAERMVAVLDQMLVRQPQVRVRSVRSLARSDLVADAAAAASAPPGTASTAAAAPAAAASASGKPGGLYRHGVEITLEGSYADLVAYLRALDEQPQKLLPGGLQLRVDKHPTATLTLRLYTLSMDRHWLEI